MTTRTLIAATLAAALVATGCEKKPEEAPEAEVAQAAAPAVDLAAEEQAIRNRSGEWMNFANAKDTATVANGIFVPDAIATFAGKVYRGSAEIQKVLDENAKKNPDAVVSWTTASVTLTADGTMAVEKGDYYYDPDGEGKKPHVSGTFVTVWEKIDGTWRAAADIGADKKAETATPTT